MKEVFLRFLSGRTFQVISDPAKARNRDRTYFLFSDVSAFRKYFDLEAEMVLKSSGGLYLSPNQSGIEKLTGREGNCFAVICDTGKIREKAREQELEIPASDCMIISEEPATEKKSVVDISDNICSVFQAPVLDGMIPVSASPFSSMEIEFQHNSGKSDFLSFGNEKKFTLSFLKENKITLSPNFGALEGLYEIDGMDSLVHSVVGHMKFRDFFVVKDFNSYSVISDYIRKFPKVKNVSHVNAHLANAMFENGFVKEKGIGVVYDGVSYDEGDRVLGSEILYGSIGDFEIVGNWKPVPLPGGDIANIEPWRIALALIKEILKGDLVNFNIPLIKNLKSNPRYEYIFNAINQKNINYSLSYCMHHIIAALGELLTYEESTFDPDFFEKKIDAAIADRSAADGYPVRVTENDGRYEIDTDDLFNKTITDIFSKVDNETLVKRAFTSIATATLQAVEKVSRKHNEKKVFLCGELFKHAGFLKMIHTALIEKGFKVFLPKKIPLDDSGVSAGQLIYSFFEKE